MKQDFYLSATTFQRTYSSHFKGNIHQFLKEIFISVLSSDMAGSYLRPLFVGPLTHITLQSLHLDQSLQSQSHICASSFSFEFPFNRYSNCTKSRLKFIQPIILFLVQSIGKYQIPRELTMILLFGIKMWTRKGGRSKKIRPKIGHNSVEDNWREF